MFDIFFFIDESPWLLLFGVHGTNESFELKVHPGFEVDTHLDNDAYYRLCRALNLTKDPNNPFKPIRFLEAFNIEIPEQARLTQRPTPAQIIQYRKKLEEADKIYFCGWQDNSKRGVTPGNLKKTHELLGYNIYVTCRDYKISSCWTDDKQKAKKITVPDV